MVVMSSELRALDGDGAHTLDDLSFCCLQYSKLMSKKDKNKHKTKQKRKTIKISRKPKQIRKTIAFIGAFKGPCTLP